MTRKERLQEFYRRLHLAPHAHSSNEALRQIQRIMYKVEDELSGIPRREPPPAPDEPSDGRMYPPIGDEPFTLELPDGGKRIRTAGHSIILTDDGGIEIINRKTGVTEFKKAGAGR